jgi:hypothetical protein
MRPDGVAISASGQLVTGRWIFRPAWCAFLCLMLAHSVGAEEPAVKTEAPATAKETAAPEAAKKTVSEATPEIKPKKAEKPETEQQKESTPQQAKTKETQAEKPAQPKAEPTKEKPKPEKPPKPKASWQYHPSLGLTVAYDETLYPRIGSTRDPEASFVTTVAPGIQVRRQQGRNYADLRYNFYARFYEEMRERDSQSHSLNFTWYERPSNTWGWRFYDRFTYLDDVGGAADDEVTTLITYADNVAQLDGDVQLAKEWKLLAGMAYHVRDNQDPIRADWYTLSPKWGLEWKPDGGRWTLNHDFKYLDIEQGEDERTHRILAGHATKLPWNLSLDVRLGVLYFESVGEVDPAGLVNLYRRWPKVRASLRYERSASVSTGTSRVVRRDYLSFVPTWTVVKNTSLSGRLSVLYQKSTASELIDTTTWRSGVSLHQRLNKYLTGALTYTYVDQHADGTSGLDLHGSIIAASLTARY